MGTSFFASLLVRQPAAAAGRAVAAGVTNVSVGAAIDRLNWADTGGGVRANRKIEGTRERGEDGRTGGNQDGENIKEGKKDGKERKKNKRGKREKRKGKRKKVGRRREKEEEKDERRRTEKGEEKGRKKKRK